WEARRCRAPRSSHDAIRSPQLILSRSDEPEVFVGAGRGDAAARRPVEKADLDEKRLVDVFDGVLLFTDRGRQAAEPDGPAAELVDDRAQQPAIGLVEAVGIDLHQLERIAADVDRD